jgi:putative DNA primase/helicase
MGTRRGGWRWTRRLAVDGEATIPSGNRNAAPLSLAGAMRRRGAVREAILEGLLATNAGRCRPPLDDAEVTRIADSVVRYNPTSMLLTANRTDLGHAQRYEAFAVDRFCFIHPWGSCLWFDGTRW